MMKRPRSFISTLLIFLSLATVTLGLTVKTHDAQAGPTTRLMDPRAGEPDEPSSPAELPGDTYTPAEPVSQAPALGQAAIGPWHYTVPLLRRLWTWWSVLYLSGGKR